VNFFRVKLSGADLTGADIAGADFTEADLDGTVLKGVKGLDAAKGMDKATTAIGRPLTCRGPVGCHSGLPESRPALTPFRPTPRRSAPPAPDRCSLGCRP
jgi:hypothetical protein